MSISEMIGLVGGVCFFIGCIFGFVLGLGVSR
jgi:hypothetical protein